MKLKTKNILSDLQIDGSNKCIKIIAVIAPTQGNFISQNQKGVLPKMHLELVKDS